MVYVDTLIDYGWKYGKSCHMIADTLDELHEMADKIGLKRNWFQLSKGKEMPHYDLTEKRRKLAVRNGAKEINRRELCAKLIEYLDKNKTNGRTKNKNRNSN